jgi:hypothetical protein
MARAGQLARLACSGAVLSPPGYFISGLLVRTRSYSSSIASTARLSPNRCQPDGQRADGL